MQIIKGTDASIKITFTKAGVAFNITGYTVLFTVKKTTDIIGADATASIKKNITTHSDPTHGITYVTLSNTDTEIDAGDYYWDIRLVKNGVVSSTAMDTLQIVQNVTIRKTAI